MEKRSSLLLALLFALAVAVAPSLGPAATTVAAGAAAQPKKEAARSALPPGGRAKEPLASPPAACSEVPAPLRPVCLLLQPAVFPVPPSKQAPAAWLQRARSEVRSLVALVADPVLTGDRLRLDRAIESIQNAAAAAVPGYEFDSYWLPWKADAAPDENAAEHAAPPLDPGLLLFRGRGGERRYLAVFLVGESPVQGVNRPAFRNALHHMAEIAPARPLPRVDLAGPNFSGSFASLAELIDESGALASSFRLYSPSATGIPPEGFTRCEAANEKQGADDRARRDPSRRPDVCYRSLVHSDRFVRARFIAYLEDRWHTGPQTVATLAEGSTAFGANVPVLNIQFPRQIARLRIAHPEATPGNLLTSGGESAAGERLAVPLRESQAGQDSVPTFAARHRPVAQEATLLDIVSVIRQERPHFVQIVATDILDTIFLGGFVRDAYPDARIVVANADMLVTTAADRLPLSGTLALTAFPLFLRNQLWTQPGTGPLRLRPMSSRFEYGLFNACLALLAGPEEQGRQWLAEYWLPQFGYHAQPPLWLTAVGTNGYWPVALLDLGEAPDERQLAWPPSGDPSPPIIDVGSPKRSWEVVFWLLNLCAAVAALAAIAAAVGPRRLSRRLPGLLRAAGSQVSGPGMSCILVAGCLSLAAAVYAMASPVWWLTSQGHAPGWGETASKASTASFIAATIGGLALLAAVVARRVRGKQAWKEMAEEYAAGYVWLAASFVVVFAAFVVGWSRMLHGGLHLEPLFMAYRSLDLLNGVSPVLPFLLLGAGLGGFALLHGLRHAIYLEMAPSLPRIEQEEATPQLEERVEAVRDALGHPFLSRDPRAWALFLCGGISVVFLWPFFSDPPQSLESRSYDLLYSATLVLLYGLVLLAWTRFLFAWYNLRAVLGALERHPVRLALNEMPHPYSTLPILQGTGKYSLPSLLKRSVEILRLLVNTPPGGDVFAPLEDEDVKKSLRKSLLQLEADVDACEWVRGGASSADPSRLRAIHRCLLGAGNDIARELNTVWAQGSSAVLERSFGDVKTVAVSALPDKVVFGREFLAVQYVMFACNAIRQLRNMLLYLAMGFFLGVLSSLVYPFRSQERLVWVATANFVILGLPVAVAIFRMEGNETLRRLTDPAGKKGTGALLGRLAAYALLPLLTIVTSHVPAIGRFLVSILEPAIRTLP